MMKGTEKLIGEIKKNRKTRIQDILQSDGGSNREKNNSSNGPSQDSKNRKKSNSSIPKIEEVKEEIKIQDNWDTLGNTHSFEVPELEVRNFQNSNELSDTTKGEGQRELDVVDVIRKTSLIKIF